MTDDASSDASIKRNNDYTEITAKGVPTSGTYYLMVQGVSGSNSYAFAKQVSSGTATIKTSDITTTSVSSFEGAKAWVEKAPNTSTDGQLLYANALTTINSSTPLSTIDPTINSTSTSTVYAPNKKLSEVAYPTVTGTAGSWSWDDPNAAVGDVGSHSFNATFTPTDTNTYNTVTKSISVTVTRANPDYTAPTGLTATYGDTLNNVSLSGGGGSGTWGWKTPSESVGNVGDRTFKAVFTPNDTTNYNAVEVDLTVTVNPKTASFTATIADKHYDGKTIIDKDSVTPTLTGLVSGDESKVTLSKGTASFQDASVGQNKAVTFSSYGVSGASASNYTLTIPTNITANIVNGFTPVKGTHYTVSSPDGTEGWYSADSFKITARAGYLLSETGTDSGPWQDEITRTQDTTNTNVPFYVRRSGTTISESTNTIYQNEISVGTSESYKKDSVEPTCTITIGQNSWNQFLNWATFGYFFKDTIDINITANDSGSNVKSTEYQLVEKKFSSTDKATIIDELNKNNWNTYLGTVTITPETNQKFAVYAKVTDNAGNVTVINTDGIVIYKDSSQNTESISFTKTTTADVPALVNLNGNTISKITNSNGNTLVSGTDYITNDDGKIQFKADYLEKLAAKAEAYILTVYYNPAGEPFDSSSYGSAPNTTTISLKVLKHTQSALTFNNLSNSYTYGDAPIKLETIGGSSAANVVYSLSDVENECVSISGDTITINKPGAFKVIATKPEDGNYESITAEQMVTIKRKKVYIENVTAHSKAYDSTDKADFDLNNARINGKLTGDNLEINDDNAIAAFSDKNAEANKTVNFSGFKFMGIDEYKYEIASDPTASATISACDAEVIVSVEEKVYNGETDATIVGEPRIQITVNDEKRGPYEGDDISIKEGKTAEFNDKTVGQNKPLNFSNFSFEGKDKDNYNLKEITGTGNIAKAPLNIKNFEIKEKHYDGTNTASFIQEPELDGLMKEDDVRLQKGTPYFKSIEPGDGINIIFNPEFSIKGEDFENYELLQPETTSNILEGFTSQKDEHYTVSEKDGLVEAGNNVNGWYRSEDFKIIAEEGFKVSDQNIADDEVWKQELIYSAETPNGSASEIKFYVRRTGAKTDTIEQNEISIEKMESYKKDQTAPEGSISLGTNIWKTFVNNITFGVFFKDKQTINIESSDDNSGIYKTKYYKSENPISESDIVNLPEDSWTEGTSFDAEPDSKFIVYVKITDNAGNIKYIGSDGIVINASAPSISISGGIPENTWSNKDKLDVTVSHPLPVIDSITYKIGNGESVSVDVQASENEAPDKVNFSIEDLPDGEYDMNITAGAKLGINTSKTFSVKKDTSNPIISQVSVSPDSGSVTNKNVTAKIDAFDELSKLSDMAYSFDSGNTWQSSPEHVYTHNTIVESGAIQVKDTAGNITKYDQEIIIDHIDKLNPHTPTLEGCPTRWVNNDVELKVISKDKDSNSEYAQSGLAYFEYSIDGGETFEKVEWSESPTFTVTEHGDYTDKIFVRVADNAGNISDLSAPYTVKIDKHLPKILSVTGNAETWTNKDVILTVEAQDEDSDLAMEAYSFDSGNTWQSSPDYVYTHNTVIKPGTIQVKDVAGNITSYEEEIEINKIDKLTPSAPTIDGASEEWKHEDVVLTVVSKDKDSDSEYAQSGLAYFEYSIDGGETFEKVEWSENPTFTVTEHGDYTNKIFVRVADNAGNISDLSAPYTVKIDKSETQELEQSNEESEQEFRFLDEKTGVLVRALPGVIPNGSTIVIDPLSQDTQERTKEYERIYGAIDTDIRETLERCKLFEIHIKDVNGNLIQPNGSVEISIPIPDDFDKSEQDLDVYRVQLGLDDDDDFEEYIQEIDGIHYCTFSTDHFSPYALIDKDTKSKENKSANAIVIFSIIFLAITLAILLIIILIRKSKNKN